jgi:hypothetical protein
MIHIIMCFIFYLFVSIAFSLGFLLAESTFYTACLIYNFVMINDTYPLQIQSCLLVKLINMYRNHPVFLYAIHDFFSRCQLISKFYCNSSHIRYVLYCLTIVSDMVELFILMLAAYRLINGDHSIIVDRHIGPSLA